jgi:hypothetical protein
MGNKRDELFKLLSLAAEEGISLPFDVLLQLSRQDTQELIDSNRAGVNQLIEILRNDLLYKIKSLAEKGDIPLLPELWDANKLSGMIPAEQYPLFTQTERGAVPPTEGQQDIILTEHGWNKRPPSRFIQTMGGGGTRIIGGGGGGTTLHSLLTQLDYASSGHTGFQPTLTAAALLVLLLTVDGAGSGLDADLLDGQHGANFLAAASYTAADVLAKLLTVDGGGSGLDADLLDGQHASAFALTTSTLLLVNDQVGTTYTLVVADRDKLVRCANAAAITVTVDTNANQAFPIGSVVIVEKYGAGNVKIVPAATVTINSVDACNTLNFQYSVASLIKTDTNVWLLSGDLCLT